MMIIRDWQKCPEQSCGAVIAIGNFDGIHNGHLHVLAEGKRQAESLSCKLAVMTFTPHPRRFFNKSAPENSLTNLHQQTAILKKAGVEIIYLTRFNSAFARLSPLEFVDIVLKKSLAAKHVITGADFSYGNQRAGNSTTMKADCAAAGIGYSPVAAVEFDGKRCSSSNIRELIQAGDVAAAASILGRNYAISGKVTHGDKRGRTIGFPTANITAPGYCLPKYGVYAVMAELADGRTLPAVANIGIRPTITNGDKILLEVHIPDFYGDLYGQRLEVHFHANLRDEKKFNSFAELSEQIKLDVTAAIEYFRKHEAISA